LNRAEMHRVAASEDRARASMDMHFAPEEQHPWNEAD
jgi:hypothetical protein